jgi:hypothetical protein
MSRKRPTAEEIVAKLRQVEVLTAQGRTVAEALRSIGVTEVSSATSCSTARSSLRSRRPRSSSRAGVAPTTPFAPTHPSAPSRPHPRFSSGRLRFPGQLRRPPRPWRSNLSGTNIRPGPPHGGRPTNHSEKATGPAVPVPCAGVCDMCERPLWRKKNFLDWCSARSGADMCAAFDAAHTPQARMGVRGPGPSQAPALEAPGPRA